MGNRPEPNYPWRKQKTEALSDWGTSVPDG